MERTNLLSDSERAQNQVRDLDKSNDNEHDWWASDSGSSTGSYYSDTGSSDVEWESEISPTGEVLYIESLPDDFVENIQNADVKSLPQQELTRRRSMRAGKLMQLIRRRESKRWSTKNKKSSNAAVDSFRGTQDKESNSGKEVTFRDFEAGEIREVVLWVNPDKRHKLGRRATLCEAYLGIMPGTFSDKLRVMVAGFVPDGEAIKNRSVKIGDWLRSVNSQNVTLQNLDTILAEITSATNVKLELQRVAGVDVTTKTSEANTPKQSILVQQLVNKCDTQYLIESLLKHQISIIYLETNSLTEDGTELQGVLYTYPRSEHKSTHNILGTIKGAFITLNDLLPTTVGLQPISTTIYSADEYIHVVYVRRDNELLLMALPDQCCALQETVPFVEDIVRNLELTYQSLSNCFSNQNNHEKLDHLFLMIFSRLLNLQLINPLAHQTDLKHKWQNLERYKFNSIFSVSHMVQLPRDAQIQIDAALNEMEAMDYRDWNEDPMDCQRLYTILGSCLYHKSYLLGTHLPHNDLIDINSFLRHNGFLELTSSEPVKSLIVWRRIYPQSCNRGVVSDDSKMPIVPNGKWFLLVVGSGHDMLAVLLESGGCTAKFEESDGPDVFYVEEAQETLKHIQKIGITTVAAKLIASNACPEILILEDQTPTKTTTSIAENLLGFIKSSESPNSLSKQPVNVSASKKSPEVSSILKKRNSDETNVIAGSVYSLQTSEDSLSQGTGAVSEISDEAMPILGRRATRERMNNSLRYSDDSDSDIDACKNSNNVAFMDITSIRESLLNQAEYVVPKKLTAGDKNYLFQYVQLDMVEGILLSSTSSNDSPKNTEILENFNRCVHMIHKILHNTVRFKKMLSQDIDKTVINKSLIAIKEHGVLFEWENVTYWVVGRLFTIPHPKELYVCYQDCAPQNLIEIAFRLI